MFCHKCGYKAVEGAIFCEKCGAKLIKDDVKTVDDNVDLKENASPTDLTIPSAEAEKTSDITNSELYDGLKSELKDSANKFPKPLIVIAVILVIALIVLILIGLGKLIFSSIYTMIGIPAGVYFIYQVWISVHVVKSKYESSNELKLPENATAKFVLESLSGKFNYPYFKEVRYGTDGECIIEGKYGTYPIAFNSNNRAFLKYNPKKEDENIRLVLREAITIWSYLNKFFNPTMPFDTAKELKFLKSTEWQVKTTGFITSVASALIVILLVASYVFPSGVLNIFKPGAGVRDAYLSEYSEKVTIEEAFNNFFDNPSWDTYESDGYSYVVFTGVCLYDDERADVRINFKITGENFAVDSMDINGQTQNDWLLYSMFSKIYEGVDTELQAQTGSPLDSMLSEYYY